MSRGKNLQEMEVGTTQSKTAVNASAKAGDAMPKLSTGIAPGQTGSWEDLGGPTPDNYRPDDDSAKLNMPGSTLKPVKNVVNKGAKSADPMGKLASGAVKQAEDFEYEEDLVEEADDEDEDEDEDDDNNENNNDTSKSKLINVSDDEDDADADDGWI